MSMFSTNSAATPAMPARVQPGRVRTQALILDDSEVDRSRIRRMSRTADIDVTFTEAATIQEFGAKLDTQTFDIVLLDYRLVQGDGLIALEMLRRHPNQEDTPSIMIAGEGQIQVAVDALKGGCSDYLIKENLTPDLLGRAIVHAIEKTELKASLSEEESMRSSLQSSLGRFSETCGAEMRTILSGMLRRSRGMRRNPAAITEDDVAGLEKSCERLWEFLEEFRVFVSDAADRRTPRRVN